ncbi:hypothetical protein ACJX0J_027751 [Zea mays]
MLCSYALADTYCCFHVCESTIWQSYTTRGKEFSLLLIWDNNCDCSPNHIAYLGFKDDYFPSYQSNHQSDNPMVKIPGISLGFLYKLNIMGKNLLLSMWPDFLKEHYALLKVACLHKIILYVIIITFPTHAIFDGEISLSAYKAIGHGVYVRIHNLEVAPFILQIKHILYHVINNHNLECYISIYLQHCFIILCVGKYIKTFRVARVPVQSTQQLALSFMLTIFLGAVVSRWTATKYSRTVGH